MFEEFDQQSSQEGRGRRGVSALLSLGIFGGLVIAVGGAITAHQVRKHRETQEQQVAFADLPQVRAPKPKPLVKAAALKKLPARRTKVADLKEIPAARPDEADGDLITAEDTGAQDGLAEKKSEPTAPRVEAPPPPPPPRVEPVATQGEQEREAIEAPRFLSGCRSPDVPPALLSNAATIRIEVEMLVDADGKVSTAKILQSHRLIPDELILQCARAQLFEPAHLPDGTPVPYPFRRRFVFKPAQV